MLEIEEKTGNIALIVNPSLRNQGYGKALLHEVLMHPNMKSIKKLEASIEEDNHASLACFRASGFVEEVAGPDEDGFINHVYHLSGQ